MSENVNDEQQQADAQVAEGDAVNHDEAVEKQVERDAADAASVPDSPVVDEGDDEADTDDADEADDTGDDVDPGRETEKLVAKLRKKNSENQKLRARAVAAETELLQYRVAEEIGLPLQFAKRLKGDTEEALKADAEEFLKLVPTASVLGFVPDDGRRSGVEGTVKEPSLSEIGARIYER